MLVSGCPALHRAGCRQNAGARVCDGPCVRGGGVQPVLALKERAAQRDLRGSRGSLELAALIKGRP